MTYTGNDFGFVSSVELGEGISLVLGYLQSLPERKDGPTQLVGSGLKVCGLFLQLHTSREGGEEGEGEGERNVEEEGRGMLRFCVTEHCSTS